MLGFVEASGDVLSINNHTQTSHVPTLCAPKTLSLWVGRCRTSGGGAAPGRRRRRRRDLTDDAAGRTTNARNIYRRYMYGHYACPARLRLAVGVSPRACVLRCLSRVCAWAGTMDTQRVARTGFCSRVRPVQLLAAVLVVDAASPSVLMQGLRASRMQGLLPTRGLRASPSTRARSCARPDRENNCTLVRSYATFL